MRILSYNIREGGKDRIGRIDAVIRQQSADVIALLEAADRANVRALAQALDMSFFFMEANNRVGHIAWLSRLPVTRSENHRSPALAKTLSEIEVVAGGQRITLFATHLGSRWDVPQPEDELPIILGMLQRAAGNPHALVGDFNALRPGDPVGDPPEGQQKRGDALDGAARPALRPILDAGYTDCYRALHPASPGYTYASDHPWLRLDYIFASPELARCLRSCKVVVGAQVSTASDHFPVCAEFQVADL